MSNSIVTTVLDNDGKAPDCVVWAPKGEHFINAKIGGAKRVLVTKACVPLLQRDLDKRLSGNVKPVFYYDHVVGAAAFLPSKFLWDEEKGVIIAGKWTNRGREDVEGGAYGYLSPYFLHDQKSCEIVGLVPENAEVGSLVNEPAFETIERIAASRNLAPNHDVDDFSKSDDNKASKEDCSSTTKNKDMDIKKLVDLGILTEDESKAENAEVIAVGKLKELKEKSSCAPSDLQTAKKEKDDAQSEAKKAKEECASAKAKIKELEDSIAASKVEKSEIVKSLVTEAVAAGKLAPKSESIEELNKTYADNPSGLAKLLSGMSVNPAFKEVAGSKEKGDEVSGRDRVSSYFESFNK